MRFPTLPPLSLLLLPSAFSVPLSPRQDSSAFTGGSAVISIFDGLSRLSASATPATVAPAATSVQGAGVFYTACGGTSVSQVLISPCEGGDGTQGNACVFAVGRNYTITLTYTSPVDIAAPRAGLASYDGEAKAAYSGQSFDACRYTSCPVQAGTESTYIYPFRTLQAPPFDRLVFNATNGVLGTSFMCASVPATFATA